MGDAQPRRDLRARIVKALLGVGDVDALADALADAVLDVVAEVAAERDAAQRLLSDHAGVVTTLLGALGTATQAHLEAMERLCAHLQEPTQLPIPRQEAL